MTAEARARITDPATRPAAEVTAALAARTGDVATAMTLLYEAVYSGHLTRVVAAAESVRAEVSAMIGQLRSYAAVGRTVDPEAAAAAVAPYLPSLTAKGAAVAAAAAAAVERTQP